MHAASDTLIAICRFTVVCRRRLSPTRRDCEYYRTRCSWIMIWSDVYAGQAVVQVAEERRSTDQYAIKFFLSATAFQQEKNLYLDESAPLGKFLPKLHSIREAEDRFKDSRGDNMPPCIVVEKGESLEHWIEVACGSKLDTFTGLQVDSITLCKKKCSILCADIRYI